MGEPILNLSRGPVHSVQVITLDPECFICGRRMHAQFLKPFNGHQSCHLCIQEVHQEVDDWV